VVVAKACFEEAVALRPDFAEGYNNLAAALKLEERLAEALPLHEKAAALRPDFFEALENVGKIREDLCDVPAAREAYARALAVRPSPVLELHRELLCPPVFASREAIADYRAQVEAALDARAGNDLRISLERLQSSRAEPPIEWAYHGPPSRALKEKHAALFDAYLPSRGLERRPPPDGPWKVGFVVTPGHEGVFARCMGGILNRIDLERFRVAVVCSRARAGAIAAAVRRPGIRWVQLPLRFDHVADRLRAAAFDVLYYWEVGTDSTNHFLPFLRLAPVQCTGWGWPDTSGAPELDYHLTSEALAPPGAEAHFSEKLVRLPELPPYFLRPPIPERPHPPSHFGLPGDAHLYVCAQNLRKMHPDLDALVGGILRQDRRGVAVFVEDTHPAAGALLRARWRETLPDVQDRIVLVPRLGPEDYFHLLAGAHVALDPLYFGGSNTSYDLFAAGVPVVTLPGELPRSRYTAALCHQVGADACVAATPAEYVERAVALGTDPGARAPLSARIRAGAGRIFESQGAVAQLEAFFERAARAAHGAGAPPAA
jgi:predicted O-linked N-acetylglucosamine transferase (SPINDLY family)